MSIAIFAFYHLLDGPLLKSIMAILTEETYMSTIISLLTLMRVIWVIFKGLEMAHINLIDLMKELAMSILLFLTLPL